MNKQRPIRTIDLGEMKPQLVHKYLLNSVAPRPICFASTIDSEGRVNLSPFSFFNVFSANPPVVIFSPSRRGRDNTVKHSYENVVQVPEVTINMVSFDMVNQASLASSDYPRGTNEFVKAGFTEIPSDCVRPPRVGEAPVSMECEVDQVLPLGDGPSAGNLVMARVLRIHVYEDLLDADGLPDPLLLDLVGRHGGNWYCRTHREALFEIPKPSQPLGMGVDALPQRIRQSEVLTGNDLGILANWPEPPSAETAEQSAIEKGWQPVNRVEAHRFAGELIGKGNTEEAWAYLVFQEQNDYGE